MNVQDFSFNNKRLSVIVDEDQKILFIAKEVCDLLDIKNTSQAVNQLDEDEKLTYVLNRSGQSRKFNVITESGLYSLILRSNKQESKIFKKWVTSEVLPSIRKHGAYLTPAKTEELINNPDLIINLAQSLKTERERSSQLYAIAERQKKYVDFTLKVFDCDEKIDVGQAAKILELPFGRNTLFKKLREKGIFFKSKNEPKQEYINRGYFQLKQKWIEPNAHEGFSVTKVLITQKGLGFLSKIFEIV